MKMTQVGEVGELLDQAVAFALGWELEDGGWWLIKRNDIGGMLCYAQSSVGEFSPSTNWEQAGPIIERERIAISCHAFGGGSYLPDGPELWNAHTLGATPQCGPTPLVAAMRAFVASKRPK